MLTSSHEHVIEQIEAYLDNLLSAPEREQIELHLAGCGRCRQHLYNARRLSREIGPVLHDSLGDPALPVALRQRVRQRVYPPQRPALLPWRWSFAGQVLNAAGTIVIIILLATSALVVVQSYLPGDSVLTRLIALGSPGDPPADTASSGSPASPTPSPTARATSTPAPPTRPLESVGDTLSQSLVTQPTPAETPAPTPLGPVYERAREPAQDTFVRPGPGPVTPAPSVEAAPLPGGVIAFAFYNPAPGRKTYEIHLINPDGSDHRLFPLDGVSEPALRRTEAGEYRLAYRAYSAPTSPRSLLSSNLDGESPRPLGGFWEDAQPDWSPLEDRLIFASRRESDRRWRLYTIWGDGSAEVNLRREGESPTFAPDGQRFAFKGCDSTRNRCGLWVAPLNDSEYGAEPLLMNPLLAAPDWSPVSEEIAYMVDHGGNWDIYVVGGQDGQVRRITDDPAADGLPAWSPDGEWLAFLSNRNENWGIWAVHVESGQLQQVYSFDGGIFTPPPGDPYQERNWWDEQISWSE